MSKIKQLEWQHHEQLNVHFYYNDLVMYDIFGGDISKIHRLNFNSIGNTLGAQLGEFATLEEAKQAAQEHFNMIIGGFLAP